MALSREQILEAPDAVFEVVEVPEWGGTVRVRSLTGYERDQYEQSITVQNAPGKVSMNLLNARAKLVALTVVSDEGDREFSDEDALELGKKNAQVLNRIWEVATRLAGLSEADVKELTETFGDGLTDGPSSDSPQS